MQILFVPNFFFKFFFLSEIKQCKEFVAYTMHNVTLDDSSARQSCPSPHSPSFFLSIFFYHFCVICVLESLLDRVSSAMYLKV